LSVHGLVHNSRIANLIYIYTEGPPYDPLTINVEFTSVRFVIIAENWFKLPMKVIESNKNVYQHFLKKLFPSTKNMNSNGKIQKIPKSTIYS